MAEYLDNTGVNGLANIGNTCYMNCILQCLAHCRGFRDLFLLGQYKQQINKLNPIGTGGKTAEVFHSLLQDMWSSKKGASNPQHLKAMLSNKSDMYSGFQQQDAQEFLSILLDTLHEDLNQGDLKKTFEMPDGDGKCDEEVAKISWNFHKQRNNSYFVDNFMGQYKSKVSCLECGKVSITFDPYMYLSLTLAKDKSPIEYYFLSIASPAIGRCKVYARLPVNARVLLNKISEELKVSQEKLSMFNVSKSTILKAYECSDVVTADDIDEGQLIVQENKSCMEGATAFKVVFTISEPITPKVCSCCGKDGELKRCLRCRRVSYCDQDCQKQHYKSHKCDCKSTPMPIGIPLMLFLKNKDLKYEKLQQIISTANMYLNFSQKNKTKLRYYLKVGDNYGNPSMEHTLNTNTKASDFIEIAQQGLCLFLEYDNSSKNITGQQEYDIFDHTSLRLVPPKSSLVDCFESFTQEERLPDTELWKCPRCRKLQKATKQISLYSCPNYLIVHLKRFQAKNIIMFDKDDKLITFPIKDLNLSDYSLKRNNLDSDYYVYDLFGVANHYGSLYRGHYTAYARLSGPDSAWREFDDRTVTDLNENSVQSDSAYVLFYKRRQFSEDISKGILSSEDDEEYFDAETGHPRKDSDHSDNSCYYEAKISDDDVPNLNANVSKEEGKDSDECGSKSMEKIDSYELESQKIRDGSSSSDLSCEYIKVGSEDLQGDKDDCGSEATDLNLTEDIMISQIEINFEDELD